LQKWPNFKEVSEVFPNNNFPKAEATLERKAAWGKLVGTRGLGLGIGHIGPVNRITDYQWINYRLTDS
jgi:hypothetical protein